MSSDKKSEKKIHPQYARSIAIEKLRKFFEEKNIKECFTNLLVKSGAIEPYIDTVKISVQDKTFFLPTSPEFALKKAFARNSLNAAGTYEIAHAFRDDLTSNLHAIEFTMVEWYLKETNYLELISFFTSLLTSAVSAFENSSLREKDILKAERISVRRLFQEILNEDIEPDFSLNDYQRLAKKYKINLSEKTKTDSETEDELLKSEAFTLLFDNLIHRQLEKYPVCFVYDYPYFLRGMAEVSQEGWAKRVECYTKGVETASGYQELSDADELKKLWEKNNAVRVLTGKEPHPLDEELIAASSSMKNVSGMGMGLERVLMQVLVIENINAFS
ncbi:MAG: hypothetical protein OEZ13_07865 [Spirochaetia bacterium]|nr:hypothetical protein [Spirochaetia bacterium]